MKISELNGKRAKIGKNSITVKDENGKTCGVITNAMELQARETSELWKIYRPALGTEAAEALHKTRRIDGKPVFLVSIRSARDQETADLLKAAGITVAWYYPA